MTAPVGLPLVIQSLPALQNLANAEAAGADTQQSMMSPLIQAQVKEEKQKPQEVQPQEGSDKVKAEKDGQGEKQEAFAGRRRHREEERKPPPETTSSNSSALAGNLLSLKV